jgi:D-sedoheptulose 7-phosphate isomerase
MQDLYSSLGASLRHQSDLMHQFCQDSEALSSIISMVDAMVSIFKNQGKVLVCGNGGSACQAMHFAEELTGRYRADRAALPAIALSDVSHVTCVGNDYGFSEIFSRSVEAYGRPADGLLILSTSGNSANLVRAQEEAKARSVTTFALLGKSGGQLNNRCDYQYIAPGSNSDDVQNIHMIMIHLLIEGIERRLFPENYT